MARAIVTLALVGVLLVPGTPVLAESVRFPLIVDFSLLTAALRSQMGADATGKAVLWGTDGGCHSVVLSDIAATRVETRIGLIGTGRARLGFGLLGFCFSPLSWDGLVHTRARPEVGLDWRLRLRDLDSAVLGKDGKPTIIVSRLWDVVRGRVEEQFADVAFDLTPPADETKALLRASLPATRSDAAIAAIDSLRPVEVSVDDDGIRVTVSIDVPDRLPTEPGGAEPPIAGDELVRWEAALQGWDAFLTFVVKGLGVASPEPAIRDALLDILLESRHAVLTALSGPPQPGADPVRRLFLDSWNRLHGVVRDAMRRGDVQERALRYTAFLAAGDALATLDTVGNGLGLEISSDGLRRLARILDPTATGDPLAYSHDRDQELQGLFGFHEPDSGEPLREEPIVPPTEPGAWWWLAPRAAHAADVAEPTLSMLARRLDRWVPSETDVDAYRDAVGRVLGIVAEHERDRSSLSGALAGLYGHLVPSVAWQESCWRQFVRRPGGVTFLRSTTDDVGIMQVNRRVWRGFFDVRKLEWDVVYNVGAGAEILAQLLTRYGTREATERLENAARATYSAYNGGPAAYRRYRSAKVPAMWRAVDRAFWEKYQAMAAGQALDFVLCTEAWGTAPKI